MVRETERGIITREAEPGKGLVGCSWELRVCVTRKRRVLTYKAKYLVGV